MVRAWLFRVLWSVAGVCDVELEMRRLKQSRAAYEGALHSYRELAKTNPAAYQREIDATMKAVGAIPTQANGANAR
jgi:uncharacterized protein YlxW (UPF0749 family)